MHQDQQHEERPAVGAAGERDGEGHPQPQTQPQPPPAPSAVVKTELADTPPADYNQHSRQGGTTIKQEQMGGQHDPPAAAAAAAVAVASAERVQGASRVKVETGASGAKTRDGRGPEGASGVGHQQGEVVDLVADGEGDERGGGSSEYVDKLHMLSHVDLVAALKKQKAHAALEVVEEMAFDGRNLASLRGKTVSQVVLQYYDGERKHSGRVGHLMNWIDDVYKNDNTGRLRVPLASASASASAAER